MNDLFKDLGLCFLFSLMTSNVLVCSYSPLKFPLIQAPNTRFEKHWQQSLNFHPPQLKLGLSSYPGTLIEIQQALEIHSETIVPKPQWLEALLA